LFALSLDSLLLLRIDIQALKYTWLSDLQFIHKPRKLFVWFLFGFARTSQRLNSVSALTPNRHNDDEQQHQQHHQQQHQQQPQTMPLASFGH
jgi:hypothetical protein